MNCNSGLAICPGLFNNSARPLTSISRSALIGVMVTEDSGVPARLHYILFPCRRCGALTVAMSSQKTKQCPACNLSNNMAKVVVIRRFDNKEVAVSALRLAKIPPSERDGVPYLAGSAANADKRTTAEEVKIFFWTIKRKYPDGIREAELLALARKEGFDTKKIEKFVVRYKQEGTLLETGSQAVKFV
jgi:hypothetical protein